MTERPGRLRIVRNGVLDPTPVAGVPAVPAQGLAGLMDLALHPRFAENKLIYFTYHKPARRRPAPGKRLVATLLGPSRSPGPMGRSALVDVKDIFSAIPSGNASRIVFGKDGMIYMTVGIGDPPPPYRICLAPPQDPNSLAGKVLRLKDDGTVPPDNPFVGRAGYRPEIYTMGHRNMLGLTVHPVTGAIWESENGPERRRRNQRASGREELRLAGRQRRPVLSGAAGQREAVARRHGAAAGVLGAGHRDLRPDVLHRRQASRTGKAMSLPAACDTVRFRDPDTWSVSISTTSGKSCTANRCSASCSSAFATCGRDPTVSSTC